MVAAYHPTWPIRPGPKQNAADNKLLDSRNGRAIGKGVYCTPNINAATCYARGEEMYTGKKPVVVDGRTFL